MVGAVRPSEIIFAGSGEFGLPTLRALLEGGHRVVKVFTQPDRPAGRGKKLTSTAIARFAEESGLEVVRTEDINREELPGGDLLVVIAFGQKIGPHVVNHPRLGSVNLHASLLPKYRGAAPVNWAIIKGERVTGNSIIRLAEKMDAGAVLGQSRLEIGELETAGELHDRLAEDGAGLMMDVLERLATGTAEEIPQNHAEATLARKLTREHAKIDWSRPAREIGWQVRGMYPWPGCHVRVVDEGGRERGRVTLARAKEEGATTARPGVIDEHGRIGAGNGTTVEVMELKPEGKKSMTLEAYHNGHPWMAGMRVESV